ncbi:MAG: ABC transporter substrate-binding protein [Candidatus Kaistia colombiensis]|nr:MAG: ABC transporter substrate-binding protein [Kaistia sp.]
MDGRNSLRQIIKSALLTGVASVMFAVPVVAADRANTVIHADLGQVSTLDPIRSDYYQTWDITSRLYGPLVAYDGEYNVVGDLASDYSVAADATSISFVLRDAKFHDGAPVTAEDVVYTFDRLKRLGVGAAAFAALVDRIDVEADNAFTIHLSAPSALFLGELTKVSIINSALVSRHAGTDDGQAWLAANDAGSGPYTLTSFDGNDAVLDWFDGYFMERGTRAQSLVFRRIDESATRRDELIAGNVDVLLSLEERDVAAIRSQSGLSISVAPPTTIEGLYFNAHSGPTADARVRRAIRLAYDYDGALAGIHQGHGNIPNGPLPAGLSCRPDLPVASQDLELAKQLLAEAGQQNLVLTLNFQPAFQEQVKMATLLQSNLQDIGVTLNLEPIAFPNYLERMKDPTKIPELMMIMENSQLPDPASFLSMTYSSATLGSTNRAGYSNPVVDDLLAKATVTTDPEQRCDLDKQVQTILDEDAVFMGMYMPNMEVPYRSATMVDPQVGQPDLHYGPLAFALKSAN